MNSKILYWYEQFRSSILALPILGILLGALLSVIIMNLDFMFFQDYNGTFRVNQPIDLIMPLAGFIITVAGLLFSIFMLAIARVANQYGPRIIRCFTSDQFLKFVIGWFLGTFTYLLVASFILLIYGEKGTSAMITVGLGMILGIFAFLLLILFVHHASKMFHANYLLQQIGLDLKIVAESLDELDETEEPVMDKNIDESLIKQSVLSTKSGYIRSIEVSDLVKKAKELDGIIFLDVRQGHFVSTKTSIGLYCSEQTIEEEELNELADDIILGYERVPLNDLEFAVDQLIEIYLKALSPGYNDLFTALTAIDYLSDSIAILSRKRFPDGYFYDEDDVLRLKIKRFSFSGVVEESFRLVREYSVGHPAIPIHLFSNLYPVIEQTTKKEYVEAIMRETHLIFESVIEKDLFKREKSELTEHFQALNRLAEEKLLYQGSGKR